MNRVHFLGLGVLLFAAAAEAESTPAEIVDKVLEIDAWGLTGADIKAHAVIKDAGGGTRQLGFSGRSRRYAPQLSKGLIRFSVPAELSGVGFLQIQHKDGDDERFLYMPELKRSRRIAGKTRDNAFMGTDFSYADLDRRDVRVAKASAKPDENVGKFPCYHLDLQPTGADAEYARLEMWVRKDNFVPLKITMYNKAGVLLKTLHTQEVRRVQGRWFITRSLMQNHADGRTTELYIDAIDPKAEIQDAEFTVSNLEKT